MESPTGTADPDPGTLEIHWPERFAPDVAPVHVRNVIRIAAPAAGIWAWLVRAENWPDWYPNASRVRIEGDRGPSLGTDAVFRWRTFGFGIRSHVREFVPCSRIAWDGVAIGIDVYHAWVIEPHEEGCTVVTEETQYGVMSRLGAWLMPNRMSHFHQIWLENLARQAVQGPPPD